jgi:dolichol-phosphate mannosyltransferase
MNSPTLSIILPAYKEKENLALLVPQIEEEFKNDHIEIIIVDDNSADGTRELAAELQRTYGNVILIERPGLLGIGSALRDGYNRAQGEYILSSDADLSFSPSDMRVIYTKVKSGFDLVLGYYTSVASSGSRGFNGLITVSISTVSNTIMRLLAGVGNLKNYNTNFRVIRASTWKSIVTVEDRNFFLFETIYRSKQKGARITEVPVTFSARKFGESKLNFFQQAPTYFVKLISFRLTGRSS